MHESFKSIITQKSSNLSNVPNIIKCYSTDVLNMFIKVHVTIKYDANINVHIKFRRSPKVMESRGGAGLCLA